MTLSIAIIGAGPAGCTLACFLAQRGINCIVYDDDKRPELIVGESLVSAVMPILRRLGIEKEVARISVRKPGAALRHTNGQRVDFHFHRIGLDIPNYAYNIPRPEFDDIVRKRAEQLGVKFIAQRAQVEIPKDTTNRELALSNESLQAAGLTHNTHPDMLIDATGRNRLFSRILSIPSKRGKRDDIAYFAHYDQFKPDGAAPGQVVISVLNCGWSWQIPQRDSLSVGVVLNKESARTFGKNPEQRLENIIDNEPLLSASGHQRKRLTPVMSYTNYQLITKKGYGKGWALLGDAFGFVDPMLSPGVFMALQSATLMDKYVFSKAGINNKGLPQYCQELYAWHHAWNNIIQYFYNGRLLSLHQAGKKLTAKGNRLSINHFMEWHIRHILTSMVTGAKVRSKYHQQMLHYSCNHLLRYKYDISNYAIKDTLT